MKQLNWMGLSMLGIENGLPIVQHIKNASYENDRSPGGDDSEWYLRIKNRTPLIGEQATMFNESKV